MAVVKWPHECYQIDESMKHNPITLAVILLVAVCLVRPASAQEPTTNEPPAVEAATTNLLRQLKPFVLKDLAGKEVKYAEAFKGKLLLMFFFTSWAEPCQDQVEALVTIQKQFGGKDFSVVGVSLDERGGREVRLFAQRNKVNFPILLGDMLVVQDVGGIEAVPTLCLVNQNRMLIMKEAAVTDKAALEEIIKSVRQNQQ